jgi:hypothetical protein
MAEPTNNMVSGAAPGGVPETTDAAVIELLVQGTAQSLHDAEEQYLNSALPEVYRLVASDLSNEELGRHPLFQMLVSHGSRGWEDSLL